ncbi:ribosomal l25p family domain-containing protein [Ditylenchus destructor]|nr:ribosomal l25p family domain-containing protein [Ditylenchus destructor]
MIPKKSKPVFAQDHAQKASDTPVTLKGNAMSETYVLKADLRTRVGKGSSRELRRNGQIPAVIYATSRSPRNRRLL